jgi:transaldolase
MLMATIPRRGRWTPAPTSGTASRPTALLRLFVEQGQSPWLDRLTRVDLEDGSLSRMVAAGIRGVTAHLTARAAAIEVSDVLAAYAILRPLHASSHGLDGYVSVEVPSSELGARASAASAHAFHQRIARPNLLVAIPASPQGLRVVRSMVSIGANVDATSIFSVARYSGAIDAYLSGLEALVAAGGDPATVHGVATFSVAAVDEEVDKWLDTLAHGRGSELRGVAGVAQARLAYRLFQERFSTERWARLARHGAHPQRLLWSSDSDHRPDGQTRYVEELIGPDTVHALSSSTVAAFEDHGVVGRTLDAGVSDAAWALSRLGALGVDLDKVAAALEIRRADHARRLSDRALDLLRANGEAR